MPEVRPAPPALVDENGGVVQGVFDSAVADANLEAAPLRWAGRRLPPWLARLRFKQWQHFACLLPEAFLGIAVVDLGWVRASWCHLRDRRSGQSVEHARRGPRLDLRVAAQLWDDRCWARARGYTVEIENGASRSAHRLEVDLQPAPGKPNLRASLTCRQDQPGNQPLVACLPVGPGRTMYSHKAVLPLEGEIALGTISWRADPATCFAILDVHKGYYPRHTHWQWATLAGRLADGRWLGLNLTRNPNRDDERLNENALWLDGAISHLGAARFERAPGGQLQPWRLGSSDGAVDLSFSPEAARGERLRLGLVRSVFDQLQGVFRGSVRFGEEQLAVDGLFGLCEDHDSLW